MRSTLWLSAESESDKLDAIVILLKNYAKYSDLAASTAPGWIAVRPSTMPEEDTAVLIAIMNEAENHGTGEYERFPEVVRGTIYGHPNGATADTDCGEFNDAEILGWQPLPAPPLAAPGPKIWHCMSCGATTGCS